MNATRTLALAALIFSLLTPVAHAEQLSTPASILVGAYFPNSPDLRDGVALLLATEYMANPYAGFELDWGGFSTSDNHDASGTIEWFAACVKLAVPVAFVESYVLGGVGIDYKGVPGFPLHAAGGINFNFGLFQIGAEARQVWLQGDGHDYDGLMIMTKLGYRF